MLIGPSHAPPLQDSHGPSGFHSDDQDVSHNTSTIDGNGDPTPLAFGVLRRKLKGIANCEAEARRRDLRGKKLNKRPDLSGRPPCKAIMAQICILHAAQSGEWVEWVLHLSNITQHSQGATSIAPTVVGGRGGGGERA